jgi:hypothetical protein
MQHPAQQRLQDGVQEYYQPKPDGDIDLVLEVRSRMLSCGLHANVQVGFDNNRFIIEATGKPSQVQRHLLNRYFSQQLASSSKPSIEERYCLIPNGEIKDWLTLFEQKVLPFLMENNLPMAI